MVAATAQEKPGQLYMDGLLMVRQYLGERGGGGADEVPKLLTYLLVVVLPMLPEGKRDSGAVHELRSLATALDAIGVSEANDQLSDRSARAADILMQRFKAVERSLQEGWGAARNLLLAPRRAWGLATEGESDSAMRRTLHEAAYDKALAGLP